MQESMHGKRLELDETDFERFRRLISQASGVFLNRGRWDDLSKVIAGRIDAIGVDCADSYYQLLTHSSERSAELRRMLAALAMSETRFFGNLHQFDALTRYIIPEIVHRKTKANNCSMRLWSAGCSTGQEAYSLAMAALDCMPYAVDWHISVLATDVSEEAIDTAEKGFYTEEQMAGIDGFHRDRYFVSQDGGFVVAEPLRRMVHFMNHDLVADPLPLDPYGTCDAVFCRNVIVHFNHATAGFVVDHFCDILNPGGYLFLGQSESLGRMSTKYSLVEIGDCFIYKKPLPRSIEGRRFISERRMRDWPLPPDVSVDRRSRGDRRA